MNSVNDIFLLVCSVVWFLLPAGFANMAPIFAAKLFPRFDYPVDGYRSYHNVRIFGDHKTWRGLIAGILSGAVTYQIQLYFYRHSLFIKQISIFDYSHFHFLLGSWMGASALIGDMVKSFFKRRVNIRPGKSWFPFDQIDWIVGLFLLTFFIISYSVFFIICTLIFGLILTLFIKVIGYFIKLNKDPI